MKVEQEMKIDWWEKNLFRCSRSDRDQANYYKNQWIFEIQQIFL